MYAESGFLLPYFQNFYSEFQQIEEICRIHNPSDPTTNLLESTTIFEYDLGSEGDLFKAPGAIIEPPDALPPLDPVTTAAISLISGAHADDVLDGQALDVSTQLEPTGPLMTEAFYDVKNDLIEKSAIDDDPTAFPAIPALELPVLDVDAAISEEPKIPAVLEAEAEDKAMVLQKSESSGCLTSMEWINSNGGPVRPAFLDFRRLNLEEAFGMRRAFSEGDIQTLGNGNANHACAPAERLLTIGNYTIEERKERLHRYRNKKTKRNFNRKIKYACRKALADSQPRVRGRFAKTEDSETSRPSTSASVTRLT